MKRLLLFLMLLIGAVITMDAQILRAEELEAYAKERYGDKWEEAALNLGATIELDKNNALTLVQVIDADGKTADQLYVLLNYWFTATFNDANSVIKLNDKDVGTIIAQGYMAGIAGHVGGSNSYLVNIHPIIKCDIKDAKVRITYSVPYYDVVKNSGGGWMGALSGAKSKEVSEKWVLDECYPFAENDKHKKTSSKALIMAYAYSNVNMDKIEECIKGGMVGNETDDW